MIYEVEDGRLIEVRGNKDHPMTRGGLCVKLKDFHDHHANPDRAALSAAPDRAEGLASQFERITWDEAIAEIGRRWREIIANYGSQAIMPYSYLGNMGLVQGHQFGRPLLQSPRLDGEREDVLRVGLLDRLAADGRPDRRRRSRELRPCEISS